MMAIHTTNLPLSDEVVNFPVGVGSIDPVAQLDRASAF